MNTCIDIQAHLPLYVGADLEAPLAASVRAHLDGGCADCARALAALERSRAVLLELPARSPAPRVELWNEVRAALAAESRWAPRVAPGPRPVRSRRPHLQLLTAAAALVAAAGLYFGLPSQAPVEQAPPNVVDSGVTPELPPVLVGGPETGGLRRLEPGEIPLGENAQYYGDLVPRPLPLVVPVGRGAGVDPSRPTLAGDRRLR
jgi:hypothetical protein